MAFLRPRSLSGLVLLGFAIVTLPLVAGLVIAGVQMRRLAATSELIVAEGVNGTRLTQSLFTQAAQLERQLRLYQVLDDPKLLPALQTQDERLLQTEVELQSQMRSEPAQSLLREIGDLRGNLASHLQQTPYAELPFNALLTDIARMQQLANEIATQSNTQIDAGVANLRERSARAQELMFWGFVLLIPISVVAILLFSLLLSRPLRQIDRAIDELGSGAFVRPIRINGPVDLEQLGRQLEWLRQRLLDLAQERNRFLRHMSHELKTPLANIREGTELLMDGAVGQLEHGQREVTGILRDNGIRLQRMIENLLSFSAWQTSSVGLEISEFRLQGLVKQIIENQQLALLSQRLRLEVSIDDLTIHADRGKLRLILENLLSNAVKYTPRGGTIYMRARADAGELVLEVGDTGPGIAPNERKQVFDAFYTGKAPGGHVRGTGIGLSVVLEFVMAHQGKVDIVDGEWPGAHFRIRMPLRTALATPAQDTAHAAA
ncbi:MAG: HAMP domain-containing histidine kinase [Nevskiaceae bacterium]|jgi:two-component system sensor histidine kinase GlrK|nr:HAMP domain-containing histidine kinase [Nevskiaceae bacterium]